MEANKPAWKALQGVPRVTAEFKHVAAGIGSEHPFISDITVKDDNINCWQLRLKDFDDEVPGGYALNQDLQRLQQQYGQDHILVEISFPDDYPTHPFFMRVVSPRCVMYTGHVTAGGSICVEALTCSGTPGSWQADYSVEGLINLIVINMIDCPVAVVQTLTGPGGTSGPLRVDFNCGNPTRPYSSAEAQAAFSRTLQNHQHLGWGGAGAAAAAVGAGGAGPSGLAGLGAGSLGAAIGAVPTPEAAAKAAAAAAAAVAALGDIARAAAKAKEDADEDPGPDGKHSAEARARAALIRQHKARYAAYLWRKEREAEQGADAVAAAGGIEQADAQQQMQPGDPAVQQQQRKKRQIVKQVSDAEGKRLRSATAAADADADAMEIDCRGDSDLGTNTGADLDSEAASEPEGTDIADAEFEEDSDADPEGADGLQGQQQPRLSLRQRIAAAQAAAAAALPDGSEQAAAAAAGANADGATQGAAAAAAAAAAAGGAGGIAGALSQLLYTNAVTNRLPLRIWLKGLGGLQQGGAAAAAAAAPPPAAAAPPAAPVQALAAAVGNAAAAAAAGGAGPMDQDVAGAEDGNDLPAHWDVNPYAPAGFDLIDLEGHHSLHPMMDKASVAQGHTHQQLKALVTQGLSKYDAIAALLLEKGELQDAMLRAFAYAGKKHGTVVDIWVNKCPNVPEAQKKAHNNSAEMEVIVNQLIASSGGAINKERVVRVERVQNPTLWRRFARKRQEILARRGAEGLNERLVFHGSSPAAIANIVATGFDLNKASAVGAYGKGHYFADLNTTALSFCNKGGGFTPAVLVAQAMAAAGGGGGAAANALAAAAQQQEEDHWQMIVARVPLGSQTVGRGRLTQPPEGFDSVNSGSIRVLAAPAAANVGNMYCHVVFDNDQCYPEYVVTLKRDAHMLF